MIEGWVEVIPPFALSKIQFPHVAIFATYHRPGNMSAYTLRRGKKKDLQCQLYREVLLHVRSRE